MSSTLKKVLTDENFFWRKNLIFENDGINESVIGTRVYACKIKPFILNSELTAFGL